MDRDAVHAREEVRRASARRAKRLELARKNGSLQLKSIGEASDHELANRARWLTHELFTAEWGFSIGQLSVSARWTPSRIFVAVAGGHSSLGVVGAALIVLADDPWSNLGMGLLIGALFGLGTIGVAWLEKAIDYSMQVSDKLDDDWRIVASSELQEIADELRSRARP